MFLFQVKLLLCGRILVFMVVFVWRKMPLKQVNVFFFFSLTSIHFNDFPLVYVRTRIFPPFFSDHLSFIFKN